MIGIEILAPLLLITPIALAIFERATDAGLRSLWAQSNIPSKCGFLLFIVYFFIVAVLGYNGMMQCHASMSESQGFASIYFIPGLLFAVVSFPKEAESAIRAFINKKAVSVFIFVLSWALIAELARRVVFWGCIPL